MNKPSRILKLLVVDDHPIIRDGIRLRLASDRRIQIVGEAADGREAIHLANKLKPDVVILDITMPLMNGLDAAREIRTAAPGCKVLILTMHEDKDHILGIVSAGAHGYIPKDAASSEELIHAVNALGRGDTYFNPRATQMLANILIQNREGNASAGAKLSTREREILSLVAGGMSNKAMAAKLGRSVRTVETHRENIMSKLNIHNAAGLTKYAIANGIVDINQTQ